MSLGPEDDVVARFKRSYQGYIDNLNPESKKAFEELIELCYPYLRSIAAKGEPFEDEPVEMTMLLMQHLIIKALKEEDSNAKDYREALSQAAGKIGDIENELQRLRDIIDEAISKKKVESAPEFQSTLEVK